MPVGRIVVGETDVKIEIRAFIDEIPDAVSVTGITNKSKSSYSNYDENIINRNINSLNEREKYLLYFINRT